LEDARQLLSNNCRLTWRVRGRISISIFHCSSVTWTCLGGTALLNLRPSEKQNRRPPPRRQVFTASRQHWTV